MTFIPFGSFLSVCSVSLIVATQDPILGLRVLLLGVLINQIIDQAIAPRLLSRFTGLRPAWVLISLLIGTKILGLIGLQLSHSSEIGHIKDAVSVVIQGIYKTYEKDKEK